jgi:hypothetical protein
MELAQLRPFLAVMDTAGVAKTLESTPGAVIQ